MPTSNLNSDSRPLNDTIPPFLHLLSDPTPVSPTPLSSDNSNTDHDDNKDITSEYPYRAKVVHSKEGALNGCEAYILWWPSPARSSSSPTRESTSASALDTNIAGSAVQASGLNTHVTSGRTGKPKTVILFIPGNPGILEFYIPFLSGVYTRYNRIDNKVDNNDNDNDTHHSTLAIFGQAHIGHAPNFFSHSSPIGSTSGQQVPPPTSSSPRNSYYGLTFQIQNALSTYDYLREYYGDETKIVLIGHSVGAWIALKVIKERRSGNSGGGGGGGGRRGVDAVFLLTPTISNIVKTPNGRKIWWLFKPPVALLISYLSVLLYILPSSTTSNAAPSASTSTSTSTSTSLSRSTSTPPTSASASTHRPPSQRTSTFLLKFLNILFNHRWPSSQLHALLPLLYSRTAIYAALSMANDEMREIGELDRVLLEDVWRNIWVLYGKCEGDASRNVNEGSVDENDWSGSGSGGNVRADGWVGEEWKDVWEVMERCQRRAGEWEAGKERICQDARIPHDFCINDSELVTERVVGWLGEI